MSYGGAAILTAVIGLSIVGALLLRNEEAIAKAWRERRAGKEPLGPRLTVIFFGLLTVVSIGLAITAGGTARIVFAALYLALFVRLLRSYRRSQSAT